MTDVLERVVAWKSLLIDGTGKVLLNKLFPPRKSAAAAHAEIMADWAAHLAGQSYALIESASQLGIAAALDRSLIKIRIAFASLSCPMSRCSLTSCRIYPVRKNEW